MSTFESPADAVSGTRARAAQLNALDEATATAFALLPTNTEINAGLVTFAVDTGTANAYAVALPKTATAYTNGLTIFMQPKNTNTGASVIDVDGLGDKDIKLKTGAAIASGDLRAGVCAILTYNSTDGDFYLQVATATYAATVPVEEGGTGLTTIADGGLLIGNVEATVEVVAAGATTEILVGGGALTKPVWTTASGTGAPVRVGSPALTTPDLGVPSSIDLTNAVAAEISAQQNFNEAIITDDASGPPGDTAWNLDTAQCAVHTMTAATEIQTPTNMNAGGTYVLRVVQAAGVYALTWAATYKFGLSNSSEPAANGDVVIFSFYSDGTNMYGSDAVRVEA